MMTHSINSIQQLSKTLFIFMIIGISLISLSAYANKLPDLGSPDLVEYDHTTEKRLGRAFTSALHREFNLFSDLESNNYIRKLGHRLAAYTGSNRNFSFYIIDDNSINAFAGPDGVIGIHTGLINAVHSEDELAAVIAHEISHVTQNHLSRRYEYSSTQGNLNSIASMIAAILIGMHDPNAGMAALMGGMGYNLQQQLKNSRLHESEADSIGIGLLHKAGFNPHSMGDFFGRLSKASQLDTHSVPEILRTHPVSDRRLAEADNRAEQLHQKTSQTINKDEFTLIKLRVAFASKTPLDNIETQLSTLTSNQNCYKKALTSLSKTINSGCIDTLIFLEKIPNYLTTYLELVNRDAISLNLKQKERLERHLIFMLDLHANNPALLLNAYHYYIKQSKTEEAIKLLTSKLTNLSYQYLAYKTLSETHAKNHNKGYAFFYLANAEMEIGNIKRTQYFIKKAKEAAFDNEPGLMQEIKIFESNNSNLLKTKDN